MFQENISLKNYNTFHINAKARWFASFQNEDALRHLITRLPSPELLLLGGGSNLLLTADFNGVVLHNDIKFLEILNEDNEEAFLHVGAGYNWHQLVLYCVTNNFGGLENLSLIPGCVGASPMQNIGAYGVEIKDVFYELEALEISSGAKRVFTKDECQFGYRESIFKRELKGKYIITSVTFRLKKNASVNISYGALKEQLGKMNITQPTIKDVSDAVIEIRSSKLPDPEEIGNAGSFFKNPVLPGEKIAELKHSHPTIPVFQSDEGSKVPAAWLIEQCGWKGFRQGDAGCHERQPLVLVNFGNATGNEILQLSSKIMKSVSDRFGVELEREVNII